MPRDLNGWMAPTQRWIVGAASDCDVRVRDEYVSPKHCEVLLDASGQYWVRDLGSTNGTRIEYATGHTTNVRQNWSLFLPGYTLHIGRQRIPYQTRKTA